MKFILILGLSFFSSIALAKGEAVGALEVGKLLAGLLVVIAVIFWGAWLAKKLNIGNRFTNNGAIKIISLLSLSTKEKIIVVEVGGEQIVVGSSQQGLQYLHTLTDPICTKNIDEKQSDEPFSIQFSNQIKHFFNKTQGNR